MYKLSKLAVEDFTAIYEYTLLNFGVRQADLQTSQLENTSHFLYSSSLMGNDCPEIAVGVSHYDHQRQAIFLRKRNKDIFLIRILHQQMKPLHHFF